MNNLPRDHAKQGFGRGATVYKNKFLITGTSPVTVTVYDIKTLKQVKSINLTMDVRNAVHGLEIWPFA